MKKYNNKFANEIRDIKRKEAAERQKVSDNRSLTNRIERLDAMFGVGVGAKKERARIAKLMEGSKE